MSSSARPPSPPTALAAAHLSRNNTRSNYITLSGKGAATALSASNLFSLSPSLYSFHETFSNLWPKSAKSDPRPQTWRQKNERGASLPKWRVFTSTLFFPSLLMFELGQHWTRPTSICLSRGCFRQLLRTAAQLCQNDSLASSHFEMNSTYKFH